jgi:membrane-associated phospholipid phosphatase
MKNKFSEISINEPPFQALPGREDSWLAWWISQLFSPPILAVVGLLIAALALGFNRVWYWVATTLILAVVTPVVDIIRRVRNGSLTDFHMRVRAERGRPMLFLLACQTVAFLVLLLGGAPLALVLLAGAGIFQTAFLLVVTLRWKISGHCTAAASLGVFLWGLFGSPAVPVLVVVPLVAWARIRLKRHSFTQTLAGALAGGVFMIAALTLITQRCGGLVVACGL